MVVTVWPKFTKEQLRKMLHAKLTVVQNAYLQRFIFVGESFVKNSRISGSYTDRTGNLRNSKGYVVLKDGKQVAANFNDSAKGDGKSKAARNGSSIGLAKALEIGEKFPKGLVLICVAGMQYAAAVESKGFDVITSSSIQAKNELKKAVEELQKKLQKL